MSKNLLAIIVAATAVMSASSVGVSQPQPSGLSAPSNIATELVVGDVATPAEPFTGWIGLRVHLAPGWKIYWKSPGDAGLPPEFDWSASSNLAKAEVYWPAPHRTSILGVESIGYTDDVLFPIEVYIDDPDFDVTAYLKLVLYACSTICTREERVLKADLSHPSSPDAQAVIDQWRDRVPTTKSASLAITRMELVRSTPPRLRVEATAAQPFEHPDVFVASPPTVFGGKPDIEISGSRVVLNSILYGDVADVLRAPSIEVTLVDGSRAVAASLPLGSSQPASVGAGAAPDAPATETGAGSWWGILAIAWLGGLVLNLMPCVLPVLSLKLLGAIGRGESGRTLRSDFVASAAGVVASFMALATALVAFKSAGATIGWGIQFQHPLFLAGMAMVVALFAANLLGFFEISLPPLLMNALARRGMGSSAPANFASGFVATLLATPCSAPFVGTAVGFALSRGSAEIYAVFGALGVGMASPYLVAASVPRLTAFLLPRPGAWMVQFRRAMAIPLLATTAWLVFLIGATAGPLTALLTGAALVIGVAGLWWRNNAPAEGAIIMVSSGLILAAVAIFVGTTPDTSPANTDIHAIRWRPLSELDDLKQSGDIIFVDVTAAWCATCKVNKALVLDDRNIAERLASDVIPVRADWTSPDPRIAEYLKTFGRYGLPFNVVFGPNAPNGIVLPELLTRSAVLSAFAESSGVTQSDNK